MADELRPQDIRARKFRVSRRGYDRSEVGDFLNRVAGRMDQLDSELSDISDRLGQLGIAELPDFKTEIDALGTEIKSVLAAALAAAEGLRTRAQADAAAMVAEAEVTSAAARGDAWTTGTELLEQAEQAATAMLAQAREDALFIRAEAEQDAKRLTTEARRQADEMIRSSREEGEKIVVVAKAESEAILEGARQSAEKAQERARALENRRAELLGELEAAESAIKDIESSRAKAGPAVGPPVTPNDDHTHWPEDDGTIRILPAALPEAEEPINLPPVIDAEEMAAEVARMREPEPEREPASELEPEPQVDMGVERDLEPEPEPESESDVEVEIKPEPGLEPEVGLEPEPERELEPSPEPEPDPAPAVVTEKVTVVDDDPGIAALFAKLREPAELESEPERPSAQPEPDPEPEPEPPTPVLTVVPDLELGEEFERRDRMLLPIENTGLRGLKRRIVELQNRVLEEIRTSSGGYRLSRQFIIEVLGDDLDVVIRDSFRAGHAAAAESLDADEPQLTGGPSQASAAEFAADLHRDVQHVLEKRSEGGSRRLSSDVGRVFRSWRTDDAERHVRLAARRAFNEGLLAGYDRLGVPAVELTSPGRPCGACSAGTGVSWVPVAEDPPGGIVPPVGPSCNALVTPLSEGGIEHPSGQ